MEDVGSAYHGDHWARAQEITQAIEERTRAQVIVVLGGELLGWHDQLNGHQLVSLAFEAPNNLRDLSAGGSEDHQQLSNTNMMTDDYM